MRERLGGVWPSGSGRGTKPQRQVMPCLNETIPTERGMGRLTGGIGVCLSVCMSVWSVQLCDCDGMGCRPSRARQQICESPPGKCRARRRRRISANDSVFGDGETSLMGVTATSPSACESLCLCLANPRKSGALKSQLSRGSRGRRCGRRPGATSGGLSLCAFPTFFFLHVRIESLARNLDLESGEARGREQARWNRKQQKLINPTPFRGPKTETRIVRLGLRERVACCCVGQRKGHDQ